VNTYPKVLPEHSNAHSTIHSTAVTICTSVLIFVNAASCFYNLFTTTNSLHVPEYNRS